jgi:dipeptidyl aminopeptidase/acylaminoacyl peptidase
MDGISDESVPTIIFIAGANNQKSTLLDKKIKLLRQGYAIVAMDQRGHGESGGYFSLYEKEYNDVSDVITYLDDNFNQLNCTNIGLIGMSLGGGAVIGAQALDDRVFVTVAYHPASNLTDLFYRIGVDPFKYFGFLPGMSYPYEIPFGFPNWKIIMNDTMYYRNSINLVNETNTKNLLLLHGMEDDMIHPNNSIAIVNKTDPSETREDIEIILRPGLGHGPNEQNDTSLKYTIAWFNHFLF